MAQTLPAFTSEEPLTSDTGQVPLEWQGDGPVEVTLKSPEGTRRIVFSGQGETVFLSGLKDGEYDLTIAPEGGAVSDSIALSIGHQSLAQALWLTLLGAIVFLAVLAIILRGARDGGDHG